MKIYNWFKLTLAALLISGLVSSNAMAAGATGTADALIVAPLSITPRIEGDTLSFGAFIPNSTPGVINSLTPNSSPFTTISPNTAQSPIYDVLGEPFRSYNTTVESSITLTKGPDSMTANLNFGFLNGGPRFIGSGFSTLDFEGEDVVEVVGDLNVGANQPAGAYTGTFNVFVDY